MLESLVSFKDVMKKPHHMFFWSLVLGSVAIYLSWAVPVSIGVNSGFIAVLFTIIPSAFFLTYLIRREERIEEKEIARHIQKGFLERHARDIILLLLYFGGVTAAFTMGAALLPKEHFGVQAEKIAEIRGISGEITASVADDKFLFFSEVLYNNLQVMLFSFLFSFIFGAGAVFILVWNASILGVVIGQSSKELFHIPANAIAFMPHGIPEIAGYIGAALAGGLLSAAIIRRNRKEVVITVAFDAIKLMAVAAGLILVGAAIESL